MHELRAKSGRPESGEALRHIDLFSGIGGFALAAERVWGNIEHIFCDNEPFAQAVLRKHWPEAEIYGDIRTLRNTEGNTSGAKRSISEGTNTLTRRSDSPFILTGGFPCQPFSQAGRRRGTQDDRFLWPEMARVIGEFKPTWVIAENVRGLLTINGGVVFEQVCADLEALGYEVLPFVIPACAVNAPHRRDRIWIVANGSSERRQQKSGSASGNESTYEGRTKENDHVTAGEDKIATPDCAYKHDDRTGTERRGRNESTDEDSGSPDTGRERRSKRTNEGVRSKGEKPEREDSGVGGWERDWFAVASELCRVDDGIPARMDRNPRLKALGNAIVPQVAEEIMRAIKNTTI